MKNTEAKGKEGIVRKKNPRKKRQIKRETDVVLTSISCEIEMGEIRS